MLKLPRVVFRIGIGDAFRKNSSRTDFHVVAGRRVFSACCGCQRIGKPQVWSSSALSVRWLATQSASPKPKISAPEESEEEDDSKPRIFPEGDRLRVSPTPSETTPVRLVNAVKPENLGWYPAEVSVSTLPSLYLKLSKARLTGLVVTTSMAGYALAPGAFDPLVVALTCLGTGLLSSAANSVNQTLEVPFDSQMDRTRNRVLVRRLITPLHAMSFAITSAVSGAAILWFGVNGLCATLGVLNLFLYTSVYTPMKRVTIANTWLGSIVGAIPPLMGWVACTGSLDPGAFVLAGLLYAWQFPHFNALSWNLRPDYSRAGYRMMSVTDPGLCVRTTVRYSVITCALCSLAAPLLGVTTWTFAIDSLPLNAYLVYLSAKFYKERDSKSSRKLFRYSLVYLPAVMMLMIISKKEWKQHTQGHQTTAE